MRGMLTLLLFGLVYSQNNVDFISPSDFNDKKPDIPNIILPNLNDHFQFYFQFFHIFYDL